MANLDKARRLQPYNPQRLDYAESALSNLKQLKDRPLEAMDDALAFRTTSLRFRGRHREAMENAKERYSMWAMTNIRHSSSIWAAFDLIECCIYNNEFVDAELFARTAYEIINERTDNIIPPDTRQQTLARGASYLARATLALAQDGGIAPEAKQAAGVEAIALAREALMLETQLHGAEHVNAAGEMLTLAQVLEYFTDVNDDEVIRLFEQTRAIFARVEGSSTLNVGGCEMNLAKAYENRAMRAAVAHNLDRDHPNDLDRYLADLELALSHFREAARFYSSVNHNNADQARRKATKIEEQLRLGRELHAIGAAIASRR